MNGERQKKFLCVGNDITDRKKMELELKKNEKDLRIKSVSLEEANTAMKVLLERIEEERKDTGNAVLANVQDLILPFIELLKKSTLKGEQLNLIEMIEKNLNNIMLPFLRLMHANSCYGNLTPSEIKIANFIRAGKTTKEISEVLNLSTRAIEFHRANIRKILGLNHQKINLRSYLLSMH